MRCSLRDGFGREYISRWLDMGTALSYPDFVRRSKDSLGLPVVVDWCTKGVGILLTWVQYGEMDAYIKSKPGTVGTKENDNVGGRGGRYWDGLPCFVSA